MNKNFPLKKSVHVTPSENSSLSPEKMIFSLKKKKKKGKNSQCSLLKNNYFRASHSKTVKQKQKKLQDFGIK